MADWSAANNKELEKTKRMNELHCILLPDAPPRKRRMQKRSPEREPCEMVPSPLPSTSAQMDKAPDLATPKQSRIACSSPLPTISTQVDLVSTLPVSSFVVPVDIEFVSYENDDIESSSIVPDIGSEVEIVRFNETRRRSVNGSNTSNFDETVTDWLSDSDSDTGLDDSDEFGPLLILQKFEDDNDIDLTPQQVQILQAEDSANDRALQKLLPDDCFTFNWNKDKTTFTSQRENFIGTPGPTFNVTENSKPTDIFEKMFDVEFIDLLCTETNRYASQEIASLNESNNISANSRLLRWTPTNRPEMISFLALMIIQSLYPLPNEESYFNFNGFGTMPYISKIMTYNRYRLLKSMLHFINNKTLTDQSTTSKLYKIQPIIDYFNKKFSSLYYPQQEIAIDESLLKWYGRLSIAQKIKTKAAQVGVKTYELCESSSGYLWRFSVYAGKHKTTTTNDNADSNDDEDRPDQTDQSTDTTEFRPTNATAKIVFDLIEPLLHRGHTLVMDNFYNSPLLARCLKRRQTDCYGTQRLNREFVPNSLRNLTKTDLRQGEIVASYCSDLMLMVWRDNNLVGMISTYHTLQIGTRVKFNKTGYKPSIVLDYNKEMGGIDRKDQYLSAHPMERVKSHVWYKKLFRRLFNCAVFNCFVIFNTKHKLRHRRFRTVLAENLLKIYRQIDLTTETRLISRTIRQTPTTVRYNTTPMSRDRPIVENDHFPVHSSTKRGRCWWCAHKLKGSKRTIWKCMECNVNLCVLGCFRAYHKP